MPLTVLDTWFREAAAATPGVVPCRIGCTACCHGPFDISPGDAARIADAVALLPDDLREPMQRRAREQWTAFLALLPALPAAGDLDTVPDELLDSACEAMADAPCPALDDRGACLIHSARPVTCRLMGLGIHLPSGEDIENPCPIRDRFPAYAALPPVPLDLLAVEERLDPFDQMAGQAGWRVTTVAGAIAASR